MQGPNEAARDAMMISRRRLFSLACGAGLASLGSAAWQDTHAQDWPARPIRIIESFPAGVARDARTRVIAEKLSVALGQQVYVENRPGAGGRIGMQAVANAPPDGYTFTMLGLTEIVNKYLYNLSYDPERDFIPITMLETLPVVLIVRPSLPVKNLSEFTSYAKDHPGEMTYGSTGPGSFFHLNALTFMNLTSANLRHVPYGQGSITSDLLGGHIDMVFDAVPAYLENLKGGRLRALALTGDRRATAMPDVPTFAESGLPDYNRIAFYGMAAPKGTPESVIARMQKALWQILREPELQRQWTSEGGNPVGSTSAEFAAGLRAQSEYFAKFIRDNNLKLE
jgi:tripartite-type tricarboxylate transporter receptor subunit TctC